MKQQSPDSAQDIFDQPCVVCGAGNWIDVEGRTLCKACYLAEIKEIEMRIVKRMEARDTVDN